MDGLTALKRATLIGIQVSKFYKQSLVENIRYDGRKFLVVSIIHS